MFDAESFCRDYKIATAPGYHKHHRRGWVNIVCPFCSGSPGFHLGFHIENGYCSCYRCGSHWIPKVISAVTGIYIPEAKKIADRFFSGDQARVHVPRSYIQEVIPPLDTQPMTAKYKQYLIGRDFDPLEIEKVWGVQCTGFIGSYKNRLYIPIHLHGQVISYSTRDITDTKEDKYKACPEDEEVYHHKFSLYNIDQATGDSVIVVEGPTDVWAIGQNAVALFGVDFTIQQVAFLIKRFKRIFIFFDPDDAGIKAGYSLYEQLDIRSIDCEILIDDSGKDPGQMNKSDVSHLLKELRL